MEAYFEAALRHYEDAEKLRNAGSLDNAGHLIGFAAECAIKSKISTLNAGISPKGHFPEIVAIAKKHLGPRSGNHSLFNVLKGDLMRDWAVERRYQATGNTTAAEIEGWFSDAQRILAAASVRRRQ